MKNMMALLLTLIPLGIGYGQMIQANYKSPLSALQQQGWQIHSHSLSFDEQTIVFSAKAPKQTHYDLYRARKNGKAWEQVTALTTLNTSADELYPTLGSSEQDLLFVKRTEELLKGKKTIERYYLMSSSLVHSQWIAPEVIIISQGGDISPVLLADNKTVIFASNRTTTDKKDANFALFYTQRIDQRNWYHPQLILAPENKNEHYYAPYVKNFVRQGNSRTITLGYTRQICNHRDTSYVAEQMVLPEAFHPLALLTMEGRIRDIGSKRYIPAQLDVYHAISFKPLAHIQTNALGLYKLALPAGAPYFIDITGDNYSHHYCEYDCTGLVRDTTVSVQVDLDKQLHIHIHSYDAELLLPIVADSVFMDGEAIKRPKNQMDMALPIGSDYAITYKKKGYEDTTLHINTKNNILLTQSELDIELLPRKSVLCIELVDADSLYTLAGTVNLRNRDKEELLTDLSSDTMQYVMRVRQGDTYIMYARAKGYVYKDTVLQIPYYVDSMRCRISLTALRKKMVLQLRNIQFEHNSSLLIPSSYAELDKLVKLMQDNPSMCIELSAHTDDVGSEQYNLRLSQQRGESARKYLVRQGIEAKRIIAKGYGKSKPLVPNDSDANRAKNRRVEFIINEIE